MKAATKRPVYTPPLPVRKRKTIRRKKAKVEPPKLVFTPVERKTKPIVQPIEPTYPDESTLMVFSTDIARSENWGQRKEIINHILGFKLKFEQLSQIIHRIPSIEERERALVILKSAVDDNDVNFFPFQLGFATSAERATICRIFGIELVLEKPKTPDSPPDIL